MADEDKTTFDPSDPVATAPAMPEGECSGGTVADALAVLSGAEA